MKRTFTIEDGTVVTQHKVLCSDKRILQREDFRDPDGRRHSTGYRRMGRLNGSKDLWVAWHVANGWKTE